MLDRSLIGKQLDTLVVETTAKEIRKFADAIGDSDPIYQDRDAARAAGYDDVPAPPTYGAFLMMDRPDPIAFVGRLGIDLKRMLHAEQKFTYHAPILAGERLTITERISDIYDKKNGALEFLILDAEVRKDDGTLAEEIRRVLVVRNG